MPVSEKKKVYLFDHHHERRLKSILNDRSLGISFWPDKNPKSIVTKRAETITRIIICKPLLPRHCEEKLVEQVLAFLQKYPEDNKLLKILGDYTKNDLFEYIGYWSVLVGGVSGTCCSGGVFYVVVVVYPLVLHPYLCAFSLCIIAVSITLFILNVCYDNVLGLKFGRWVGKLIKGTHQKPINVEELKRALMIGIQCDGIEAIENKEDAEATQQQTIDLEELKRKIMVRIRDDEIGKTLEEAVEELVNEKNDIKSAADIHPIIINIEEIKIKLMERMASDDVEKAITATEEAIEACFDEDREVGSIQGGDTVVRQHSGHFWATGSTRQDTVTDVFQVSRNYLAI